MICRIWRGWATPANADAYESVVRGEVIPGIEAMRIAGFRHIDLMHREAGDDYEISHVPPAARAVLARHDDRSAHYEVIDRRAQPGDRS